MYVCMHACMYVWRIMFLHVICASMYVCTYICMDDLLDWWYNGGNNMYVCRNVCMTCSSMCEQPSFSSCCATAPLRRTVCSSTWDQSGGYILHWCAQVRGAHRPTWKGLVTSAEFIKWTPTWDINIMHTYIHTFIHWDIFTLQTCQHANIHTYILYIRTYHPLLPVRLLSYWGRRSGYPDPQRLMSSLARKPAEHWKILSQKSFWLQATRSYLCSAME